MRVVLHSHIDDTNSDFLCRIKFGLDINTRSTIKSSDTEEYVHIESNILACDEFRPFWISWASMLSVGKGHKFGEQQFLQSSPATGIIDIKYMSVRTSSRTGAILHFLLL